MRICLSIIFLILIYPLLFSFELDLWSETGILIDLETEQILYEKNSELPFPPASMTKIVTLYMVYSEIEKQRVNKNDLVNISKNADYKNLPKDSSFMFIEEGQNVTLLELMLGLAIPSGNDAAIAIAEYLYGTVDDYLLELTKTLDSLGFKSLKFVDSSGFDDNNSITAKEFAQFCLLFIKKYPSSLEELFSINEFTYPQRSNGKSSIGSIKQFNHNPVLDIYPNIDGIKTGFINKSGLNIALTAEKNGRRVVAILGGVKDNNRELAEKKRVYDSITILNYGLNNFKNINLDKIVLPAIANRNNGVKYIQPYIPYKRLFTINTQTTYRYNIINFSSSILSDEFLGYVELNDKNYTYIFPVYSITDIK